MGRRRRDTRTGPQDVPRGIEVLIKKASVDPEFRRVLLGTRADAARDIGLALDPSEAAVIAAVPREQLDAMIDRTVVPAESRRAFLGRVASVMIAALGAANLSGCIFDFGTAGAPAGPHPDFSWSPTEPSVDEQVQFTDLSYHYDGTIVSWSWSFGPDAVPQNSGDQNPTCRFLASGEHVVGLVVTDDIGVSVSRTKPVVVV